MIVLSGHIRHDGSRREELHQALILAMDASLSDPGMNAYRFTADLVDPNLIHIFESWDDEESLLAHQQAQHSQDLLAVLPALGILEATLTRFDVSGQRVEF